MSSTTTNPLFKEVKEYDTKQLITFLQGKNLNLHENVFSTLLQQEVVGLDFLQWTIEKLRSEPYNFPDRSATRLVTLVNYLNSQKFCTARELYQLILPFPKVYELSTSNTTLSATRKVPNLSLLRWDTFLNDALIASSSIDNVAHKFYTPDIFQPTVRSKSSTIARFLQVMSEINNQRLKELPRPERWGKRYQCYMISGEPDAICFRANDKQKLEDIKDTEVVAIIEIKLEQLMVKIIGGAEIAEGGQVRLTDESEDMIKLYETAVHAPGYAKDIHPEYEEIMKIICQTFGYMVVNKLRYGMITTYARTWFLRRDDPQNPKNTNDLYVSPMIPINRQHTDNQASFLECMYYFENISGNNPTINSSELPLKTDYKDDQDLHTSDHSDHSDYSDQPSDNYEDDEYKPTKCQKTIKPIKTKISQNTQKLAQTSLNTQDAKKDNIEKFNRQSNDELLLNMKNYDYELFHFGETLGFGRSGKVIKARLFKKSGALKMVDLYKDNVKLEEMLNEIKIYDVILKIIQGIYIPKLLKFGVLHEAFIFMMTSFAGESFASKRDITEVEKQSAISSLLAIHALGVKHGDIRLENIMVNRNSLTGHSHVWWIDFAWSKLTDNAEVLKMELNKLKRLLR
ncbi:hypothetical protein C1645_741114 [Glomus cerebriforme]|uniref:Protein kinase domain-containing protein n=1 Tax=Glomus cerebriforme TaxID=658196 RepID=A0A397SK97_9GLOM|nr:hypothetical protein C1645_741114 [Glomus cerebriforme]